jgi:Spy/CpxP family protein refolding chaperone
MKGMFNFKLAALCAILSVALVVPALAQGKGDVAERFKQERTQMIKQMKIAPDKEKALMGVEEKYVAPRKEIIDNLKKARTDLNAALAAPAPDEAKVKDLVSAIMSGQDKLFDSFKKQRDEELGLLSPVEQGKYLAAMEKWRHGMMKPKGKAGGKKKGEHPQ